MFQPDIYPLSRLMIVFIGDMAFDLYRLKDQNEILSWDGMMRLGIFADRMGRAFGGICPKNVRTSNLCGTWTDRVAEICDRIW